METQKSNDSLEQRLSMYRIALELMLNDDCWRYFGICHYLRKASNQLRIYQNYHMSDIMANCPEVQKHEPEEHKQFSNHWFALDATGKAKRLAILKTAIKELL